MSRGKQFVKKGVWYIGCKKKKKKRQTGEGIPFGIIASLAAPVLWEVAKPILNKIFGKGKPIKRKPHKKIEDGKTKSNSKKKSSTKSS